MPVHRNSQKRPYARAIHNGIEYDLVFGHPTEMLKDPNISWESKGYLSHIASVAGDVELSPYVVAELITFGYLVEVQE